MYIYHKELTIHINENELYYYGDIWAQNQTTRLIEYTCQRTKSILKYLISS